MTITDGQGELRPKEYRWISQSFVVLHGASMVAAFGFLAETWGDLSLSLLRWVVATGWVHFAGVCISLVIIYLMEVNLRADLKYHIGKFFVPMCLLLTGWAIVGLALTDAAWGPGVECYYAAGEIAACRE